MADMHDKVKPDQENGEEEEEEVEEEMDEEFLTINSQLDQISNVLDALEAKNDRLQEQLRDLLAVNREEREQQPATNEDEAMDEEAGEAS